MEIEKRLNKLYAEKDALIVRIAGITDSVLQEQCREEYQELDEKIAKVEDLYMREMFKLMASDHYNFYNSQFSKVDNLLDAIDKTNGTNLREIIKQKRLRTPINLNDRRLLALLANEIKKKIVIFDMENITLDEIGIFDETLRLYVPIISRWDKYVPQEIRVYLVPR